MPRSRSIFIQSERVLRRSAFAFTWPARLMAPPNSRSFSVSVVLPASGCEMIANVRRRATSLASEFARGAAFSFRISGAVVSRMAAACDSKTRPDQGSTVQLRFTGAMPIWRTSPFSRGDGPATAVPTAGTALPFFKEGRMAWTILLLAGLLEIGWAIGLKYTDGFTRLWPSVWTVASMIGSIVLLGLALKWLPVGTAYAVWTGIGT